MSQFLKNIWQMAAWSEQVGTPLLSRRLADRRIVLFRKSDGTVAALDDRCPHRFAPLSRGTREGDTIVCGYHGLRFDGTGQCVGNPYSDRIPAGTRARAYPVAERHGIVWFWAGDPDLADERLVPDFESIAATPKRHTIRGYTLLEANFEFGTDNLMDLSHIEFVHKGSFAGAGVIFAGKHKAEMDGNTIHSNWWMPDIPAPAHTRGIYPPEMRTDHWLDMRWNAPASMYLQVGACPQGTAREGGVIVHQAHILTPETDGRTHYFWASTRDQDLDNPQLDEMLRSLFSQAFDEEDKPMIKAAYENLGDQEFWSAKPIFLGVDAGGAHARRLLQTLRKRELENVQAQVGTN